MNLPFYSIIHPWSNDRFAKLAYFKSDSQTQRSAKQLKMFIQLKQWIQLN